MPRAAGLALPLALALATACAGSGTAGRAARWRPEDAPRELQPAVGRAEAAVKALRERLAARLAAEVASAGIANAAAVCGREAPALAASISAQTGVEVGRTGGRLPPGARAPRPWIGPLLEETPARRAADVPAVVLDLGDRVGLLRPIPIAAPCLACHGAADRVLPAVKLAAGTGAFAEGDLRGFFWAEARK